MCPSCAGAASPARCCAELELLAVEMGYTVARLDTGPKQVARGLFESEGYVEIPDFNGNPVASYWGEKPL